MGLASAGGEGWGGGALLIRTPHLQVTDLQSCRGDHQHRTSPHGSLWNPAETRRENTEGKKKKKKKTSTKAGAKDGGRNFVQLPPLFPVPHVAPRAQQHRPCPARSHPAPGDAGTARGGAEQSGPWCPRSALCRGCPQQPQGLRVSPLAALHRPFPPLSGGS